MTMKESYEYAGHRYDVEYRDVENFDEIDANEVQQHCGVCFFEEKIVVCWHGKKEEWTLPGGKREPGEHFADTLAREIKEETNMRIVWSVPIGYQKIVRDDGKTFLQLRSVCEVRKIGEFIADAAGSITKIKCIDSTSWDEYIHWGAVGPYLLKRAMELRKKQK